MKQLSINRKRIEYFLMLTGILLLYLCRFLVGCSSVAYLCYVLLFYHGFWIIFGQSVSDESARMLRSRLGKSKHRSAAVIFRAVMTNQLICGLLGAAGLGIIVYRTAGGFAGMPHASYLGFVLAPGFLFRLLSEGMLGFCSSRGDEKTCTVASLIRWIVILPVGVLLMVMLKERGELVGALLHDMDYVSMYGCIGVCIAVDMGEALTLVFLTLARSRILRTETESEDDDKRVTDTYGTTIWNMWMRRFFEIISLLLLLIPFFAILFYLRQQQGFSEGQMGEAMGRFLSVGPALAAFFFLQGIGGVLPICHRCIACLRTEGQRRRGRTFFQSGFHLAIVSGTFGMVYMISLKGPILALLASENGEALTAQLIGSGVCALLLIVAWYFYKLLWLYGEILLILPVSLVSGLISFFALRLYLGAGTTLILAGIYSLAVWGVFLCLGYGALIWYRMNMNYHLLNSVVVPVVTGFLLGLLHLILSKAIAPHLGNLFTAVFCLVLMFFLYQISLLLLRNYTEREIKYLPGGKLLEFLGQMLHCL